MKRAAKRPRTETNSEEAARAGEEREPSAGEQQVEIGRPVVVGVASVSSSTNDPPQSIVSQSERTETDSEEATRAGEEREASAGEQQVGIGRPVRGVASVGSSTSDPPEAIGSQSEGLSTIAEVAVAMGAFLPTAGEESVARLPTTSTSHESHTAGIEVRSKHDEKWNEMFSQLQQYKAENNSTNVKQDEGKLGRWVHYQRVEYGLFQQGQGRGKITQDRIDLLDSIGFEWDPQKIQWEAMFSKLVEFKNQHGHANVSKSHHDKKLANWVRNQRLENANRVRGKKSRMTQERKTQLDELGFRWTGTHEDIDSPDPAAESNERASV